VSAPALCGEKYGAYVCHIQGKHTGRHKGYYVQQDGRVYVIQWRDKYDRPTARLAPLPALKGTGGDTTN
jgi:hypothetical protein